MIELIAVATITMLAVISPGADFAMVTRNSILYGRSAGLLSSLGIAAGVQLHVFYTMIGVGLLIRNTPEIFTAIKLIGAVYLIYVGYKTFHSKPTASESTGSDTSILPVATENNISTTGAFKNGFFTNALNPKTTLFVVSVYTQVVNPSTPTHIQLLYGLFMSFAHWSWFSLVSMFLSEEHLRKKLLGRQVLVNQIIGFVLVALGIWLSLSSAISH
jgi:threonine/homoserine/homoserine lactone efflux protein